MTLLICAACGDNNGATNAPDAAAPMPDAGFVEAPHGSVPQVISGGGSVLAAPVVVPIFFTGDAAEPMLEQFLTQLAASPYWPATTGEYGVGALQIMPSVVSTDTPPTTDAALQTWLSTNLATTSTAGWPVPTASTIYAVFLPDGVTITQGNAKSCVSGGFGGYHDEIMATQSIIYAVLPRCGPETADGMPLDGVTSATSHELVEASTDPHPFTDPAYVTMDADHFIWSRIPGAELGDMCEYLQPYIDARLVGDFTVQRTWSNASAMAGHDPCVPAPATPYIAAAPQLDDDIMLMTHGGTTTTKGVQVTLGTTKTIEVDLFSDAPAAAFTVDAVDVSKTATLAFQWDRMSGVNGDRLNLMITRTKMASASGSEIRFSATGADGIPVSLWWGFIAE